MLLHKTLLYSLAAIWLGFQSVSATWPVRNGTEYAKSNNYIVQVNPNVDLADFGSKFIDHALHTLRSVVKESKLEEELWKEGHHLEARCFSENEKKQVHLKESFNLNNGFKALAVKIMDNRVVERLSTDFEDVVSIFPDDQIDFALPYPKSEPHLDKRYYIRLARVHGKGHPHHRNGKSGKVTSEGFANKSKKLHLVPSKSTTTASHHTTTSKQGATAIPTPITYIKEKKNVPWNLRRISQRERDPDAPYIYDAHGGAGVTVYVVDDGINIAHKDFGGRAKRGWSIYDKSDLQKRGSSAGSENPLDGGGHGTHVAGIIGGTHYGVAKNVSLVSVQVLGANGRGTVSALLGGLQYILEKEKNKKRKVVVNMSLGVPKETSGARALNDAVTAVVDAGIPVVAAAGNSRENACNIIPAGNPGVYTVGSIDSEDTLDSYSCYGKCVNILAPGFDIDSDFIGSDEATANLSGTSMASPHVAGVAALLLPNLDSPTPQELYDTMSQIATKNLATGLPRRTPNLIVFNGQKSDELKEE